MTTKLTKAQLLSELEAVRIENQRLCAENESLRTERDRWMDDHEQLSAEYAELRDRVAAPTRTQEDAHDRYVRALIAAREMAARTGRSVVVKRGDWA